MTIALGILASDGVVIAADTQEGAGYPGGTKTSGQKIRTAVVVDQGKVPKRALAVSGAGSAGYLDAVHEELVEAFRVEPDEGKLVQAERTIVKNFYREHILALNVLTNQPSADLVLGISWRSRPPALMASEHSTLRLCPSYVATGAGQEHATMLLSRLLPHAGKLTVERAAFIATFTAYQVKEHVEGCGKTRTWSCSRMAPRSRCDKRP